MFALSLHRRGHVRHYAIHAIGSSGWEVRMEEDRAVRRLELYRDWHRVERALALFEREVQELTALGWEIAEAPITR
jgi:hypothetical protein